MNPIVLTQSRRQSLVNRTAKLLPAVGLWMVTVWVASDVFHRPDLPAHMRLGENFAWVAVPPILAWLWLTVFNRGGAEAPEAELRFDGTGVQFDRFGEGHRISWEEFRGYRITGWLERRIRIDGAGGRKIVIDYHAFSAEQRAMMFQQFALHDGGRRLTRA